MSAATFPREAPLMLARESEQVADAFGPDKPLTWWYVRLRYADDAGAPALTRLREQGRKAWYDRARQPRTSPEDCPVFPDFKGSYPTRSKARSKCNDAM